MKRTILILAAIVLASAAGKAQALGEMGVVGDSSTVVIQLNNATVSARIEPMKVVEDTVEYNPAAFRLSEDAMLEDLLRKIPGLEIDGSSITLHGKPIKQLLIDGQRFFGGKAGAGLQNISADMIAAVRAYERESDFTRTTGIDDGEREAVLDLKIKKRMMDGWRGNLNAGCGTLDRYTTRLNANKIKKDEQNTVLANFGNLPSKISPKNVTRTQLGGGAECDRDYREAGVNVSRKKAKVEYDANVHYSGLDRSRDSRAYKETVYADGITSAYTNCLQTFTQHIPSFDGRFEWKPDAGHVIIAKADFKYTGRADNYTNEGRNFGTTGAFSSDFLNSSNGTVDILQGSFSLQYTRRLNERKRGRSYTFNGKISTYANKSELPQTYLTVSAYNDDGSVKKSTARKIYLDNEDKSDDAFVQFAWNEPLGGGFHLQGIARVNTALKTTLRDNFNLLSVSEDWSVSDPLPAGYESAKDPSASMSGSLLWVNPVVTALMRYANKKVNVSLGVSVKPQFTILSYTPSGASADTTVRSATVNVAPSLNLTYRRRKTEKLTLKYATWGSTSSIYNLLPVSSGTNPLYLHIGNPDLKPLFSHKVELAYNKSNLKKESSLTCTAELIWRQNQVSERREYFAEQTTASFHGVEVTVPKGGTLSVPMSINGSWAASGSMSYDKALSRDFTIVQKAGAGYDNAMSYFYQSKKTDVNRCTRLMVKEDLDLVYRNNFLELTAGLNGEYTSEKCLLRPEMDQRPWSAGASFTANATLPRKTRILAEYSFLVQRGYSFEAFDELELNRNYHILNASVSQPFLKGKIVARLEANDILRQLPNLTRSFSASSRNVTVYNSYNSYILLRLIYKFKGGKQKKK